MLKFVILVAILLWIHSFFGNSAAGLSHDASHSTYFLSVITVLLIIIGFLS